jgi:quercetin dioxygenase-like cupin family protein
MTGPFRQHAYDLPVSRDAVEADSPDFRLGVFRDPTGHVWADFSHETDEVVVVASGDMEIDVEGDCARCGLGDLVLIPAGARHALRTSDAGGSIWFYGYGTFGAGHG